LKLLLTSAGITNDSIRAALVDLLGKPIAEARALYVPTAIYATPGGVGYSWRGGQEMAELGWAEFGLLELTALPSMPQDCWLPDLESADAVIVGGGNGGYLSYWLQQSGLAAALPKLLDRLVYLGVSAGSAMVTRQLRVDPDVLANTGVYYDDEYDEAAPAGAGSDRTLGLVDFVLRPHLFAEYFPAANRELMLTAAARVDVPLYAIDDQSAIKVVDGSVEVVSEGTWELFNG